MNIVRKIEQGFTLIELIVAMAVLAILVVIATPSFESVFNNNKLTSNANEMLSTLQTARMEAARRNARVVVCRNDTPDTATACNNAAGAWAGWMSFADDGGTVLNANGTVAVAGTGTARNGVREGNELVLSVGTFAAPVQLLTSPAISGGNARIRFSPDGLAYSDAGNILNAQFSFCIITAQPPENTRLITIGSGSRMAITRVNGAGACAAPTDT